MAEYLDVLDQNGNAVGRIKQRSRIHWDGDWHRTVHVWIVNDKGEVLIQKRGPEKESFPGMWDVSCAGHVASGRSSRETAIREAQEELGLTISPLELRSLGTVRNTCSDGFRHDNEIVEIYLVERDVNPCACSIARDEVSAVKLIPARELEELVRIPDPDLVPHKQEYPELFRFLRNRGLLS